MTVSSRPLQDAVALVAGGASGLGGATTEALLDRGASVVVLDLPGARDRLGGRRGVQVVEGDVRERIDKDQVNAIGGAMSDSTVDGLYLHHTKVGLWFDGPMSNMRVTNNVIVDQIADGLNFHTGVTVSLVRNNFLRNTGDDALAMWSEKTADARNGLAALAGSQRVARTGDVLTDAKTYAEQQAALAG